MLLHIIRSSLLEKFNYFALFLQILGSKKCPRWPKKCIFQVFWKHSSVKECHKSYIYSNILFLLIFSQTMFCESFKLVVLTLLHFDDPLLLSQITFCFQSNLKPTYQLSSDLLSFTYLFLTLPTLLILMFTYDNFES